MQAIINITNDPSQTLDLMWDTKWDTKLFSLKQVIFFKRPEARIIFLSSIEAEKVANKILEILNAGIIKNK